MRRRGGKAVAAAFVCLLLGTLGTSAQECTPENICSTTTTSAGAMTVDVYEYDGRRNDNFQTRVTGRIGNGPFLYDQIIYRDFPDPQVQDALEAARDAIGAAGGADISIAPPAFIEEDFSEELDQVFTETSEFYRPGGTYDTVQTTSGDADNAVVVQGDRGGCYDLGSTGPTNTPPYSGRFPDCDIYEETPVPPFTVNTNTHTTTSTEHVYYSFTNEDYIIRQHYTLVGKLLSLAPSTLAEATLGAPYFRRFTASGGVAPYAFEVVSGGLPAGLDLTSGGVLSGTASASGTFAFSVRTTDAEGTTGQRAYELRVTSFETWVSGVGDDIHSCTRTEPCRTFDAAVPKTAAGGVVGCLDPGPRGSVTITRAVTISCGDSALAGGAPTAGISISAGPADTVVLRGLDISNDQPGPGAAGIRFLSGRALHVEDAIVRDNDGFGILFEPSAGSPKLHVSDSRISGNGGSSDGGGIQIAPTGAANARAVIQQTILAGNTLGIRADTAATSGSINVVVSDSSATGGARHGIVARGTGGPVRMMLDGVISSNNAGDGVRAIGAKSVFRIGGSVVTGNGTGIATMSGGVVHSYGTNAIKGNVNDGAATAIISLK